MPSPSQPPASPTDTPDDPRGQSRRWPWVRLLRPHHWFKNALIAVPAVTAQAWRDPRTPMALGLAFLTFSLVASATYVLNDLADLEHDRAHAVKRHRPLASGEIGRGGALITVALLGFSGFAAALRLGWAFLSVTAVYVAVTTLYTRRLKQRALLDVLALAALWVLRIEAGAIAIEVDLSVWLLSFGAFLFLSLSILKRCAELSAAGGPDDRSLPGRGYAPRDLPALQAFGIGTGVVSVLVLALFVDSHGAQLRYAHPDRLWLMCPAIWFWLGRLWLETARGRMHHDPVVYSLRDRASWWALSVVALSFVAALSPL